jgi:hypothetical protein
VLEFLSNPLLCFVVWWQVVGLVCGLVPWAGRSVLPWMLRARRVRNRHQAAACLPTWLAELCP